jgi:hypothetical protein
MKSNAKTAVGVAVVNLPFTVEPHPIFWITRTEMESGAGTALARLAVAQIHPIRVHPLQLLEANRSGIGLSVPPPPPNLVWP